MTYYKKHFSEWPTWTSQLISEFSKDGWPHTKTEETKVLPEDFAQMVANLTKNKNDMKLLDALVFIDNIGCAESPVDPTKHTTYLEKRVEYLKDVLANGATLEYATECIRHINTLQSMINTLKKDEA